jgi:hypothetical protein
MQNSKSGINCWTSIGISSPERLLFPASDLPLLTLFPPFLDKEPLSQAQNKHLAKEYIATTKSA